MSVITCCLKTLYSVVLELGSLRLLLGQSSPSRSVFGCFWVRVLHLVPSLAASGSEFSILFRLWLLPGQSSPSCSVFGFFRVRVLHLVPSLAASGSSSFCLTSAHRRWWVVFVFVALLRSVLYVFPLFSLHIYLRHRQTTT